MKGKVLWFNIKKAYGFIVPEDKTKDIFVHITGVLNNVKLDTDQLVEFDITENDRGRVATNVKLIGDQNSNIKK